MSLSGIQLQADKSWTLFLDRDGVLNVENPGTYVTSWEEFVFCDGVLDALRSLNEIFGRIVIVTNQRGVGRGIMPLEALIDINHNMVTAINAAGGRIDKIYACTAISDDDHNRKPNTGMAIQAKEDFDEIDFRRSVMVGNSMSDMEFGKRMSMYTVFLTTKHAPYALPHDFIDEQHDSLLNWSKTLKPAEIGGAVPM
ncbi:D-glycero-alpha-D-manno-heptose-1,7-bisphosphate 7-phosphatase [Chitinophagaceae bacterium MMS25-I14]